MDLDRPFRHVDAVARGTLTRHHIVDGSYQPLFAGVSVAGGVTITMAVRAEGAVLAYPGAVVAGLAAAALWDVDVAPCDTTVDLLVGPSELRARPGVRLLRSSPAADEVTRVDGIRVTTPARTALDLARTLPRDEAVVVVDAVLRVTGTDVAAVRALAERHRGERGLEGAGPVLAWVDPRSPSPEASRLRLALLARGLALPLVAQDLLDGEGRLVAPLSLAWPEVRLGVTHRAGVRKAAEDVGWKVLGVGSDLARTWGTRRRGAPIDDVARWLTTAADRWDPPPRVGGRRPEKLPRPPGPDGECDGGLSRLVPA